MLKSLCCSGRRGSDEDGDNRPETSLKTDDPRRSLEEETGGVGGSAGATHTEAEHVQQEPGEKQDDMKVYENVHLFSGSSYLYYYPVMQWSMDKSPDSDDYWIGMYEKGAADDDYLAHHWIGKVASGSYKVGRLKTTAGKVGTNRFDVFELRMFNGTRRCLKTKSNNLVGAVLSKALNPYSCQWQLTEEEIDSKQITKTLPEDYDGVDKPDNSDEDKNESFVDKLKETFVSRREEGKLSHLLEQKFLSDEITDKGEEIVSRNEPKNDFPNLGKVALSKEQPSPDSASESVVAVDAPTKIVLEISLKYCIMYIYPTLNTAAKITQNEAWFGVYKANSNTMKFNYKSENLSGDSKWLRNGSIGEEELETIEEKCAPDTDSDTCSLDCRYVGVIFDKESEQNEYKQIGLGATYIHASMYVTPPAEDAKFKAEFDVKLAKKCATLSYLAYEPYETIEQQVTEMQLSAEMQIFHKWTDTDGFIASDSTTTVVAFRGTGTRKVPGPFVLPDMVTNLRLLPEHILPDVEDSPSAFTGFIESLNTVYDPIISHLKPMLGKKKLLVTGHSLGAALASLFVFRLTKEREDLKSSVTLMTFACPPVGTKEFSDYFKQLNSSHITIQGDVFSSGWIVELAKNNSFFEMYKPSEQKFLPFVGSHSMKSYIAQLENLSED